MYEVDPAVTMTILRLRGKARHDITDLPIEDVLALIEAAKRIGPENVFLDIGSDKVVNLGEIEEIAEIEVTSIGPGSQ